MEKSFRSFTIKADGRFLKQDIPAWYSLDYTNYGNPGNPDWIVDFKDDKSQYNFNDDVIQNAHYKGEQYAFDFLSYLYNNSKEDFIVCVVPRAKPDKPTHFKKCIELAVYSLLYEYDPCGLVYGLDYITRILPTRTTHFKASDGGDSPYPGITKDTCAIFEKGIRGQNVLLIDDIYTHHHRNPQTGKKEIVGVDEDCLQALLDYGAKKVAFYALAKTMQS